MPHGGCAGRSLLAAPAPRAELTITEAAASEDVLQIRATTRVGRYAHGLTKAKGLAGRHLDMEITARAART